MHQAAFTLPQPVVFIDASLPDLATLRADVPARARVHLLDPAQPLFAQMADVLAGEVDVPVLHLITHGAPGQLLLGQSVFGRNELAVYAKDIISMAAALAEDGEWLIYGCQVAAGQEGRQFIHALTAMTGLKIAAATQQVGATEMGGSWMLDWAPALAAVPMSVQGWAHTLNTAPTLDVSKSPAFTAIPAGIGAPANGSTTNSVLVSSLIDTVDSSGVDNYADADSNLPGIAITGVNDSGRLWYSTDNGATWTERVAPVSATQALLLYADANTRVLFRPDGSYGGGTLSNAITFKAWDRTGGSNNGDIVSTTAGVVGSTGDNTTKLVANGSYLYSFEEWTLGSFKVIDKSAPANITPSSPTDVTGVAGYPKDMVVDSGYLYIAASGLNIFDVSVPGAPTEVYGSNTGAGMSGPPWMLSAIAVNGNTVYGSDGDKIYVFDVSVKSAPVTGNIATAAGLVSDMVISGNYLYVAAGSAGLQIFDISTVTASPSSVGIVSTTGDAKGVTVVGNYAYVAAGAEGVRIINISDPAHPTEVGSYDTFGDATSVRIVGSTAYVADGTGGMGLEMINISDPASPTYIGPVPTDGKVGDVLVDSGVVYLAVADGYERGVTAIAFPDAFSTDSDTATLTVSPTVSIQSTYNSSEGTGGNREITIGLSASNGQDVTVQYATANGTATAGADYTAISGTATITAGSNSTTIQLPFLHDTLDETDETLTITLSNPTVALLGNAVSTVTILDNDDPPTVSIANTSLTEGNSGSANMAFTVSLSAASGKTITVNYATSNGTATAGSDYTAASGTLTFTPGQTSKTIDVPVAGDTSGELDETVTVTLSSPSNVTLGTASATGTITNDDDTTPPGAPTGLDLADLDDTGASNTDSLTKNTSALTITGAAEAGSTVELFDGTTSLGTTTATGGTFTLDVSLAEGSHTLTAKATDAASNVGAASSSLSVSIDTTAPTLNGATPDSAPANNGTNVALGSDIVIDFSENIAFGTSGTITVRNVTDTTDAGTFTVTTGSASGNAGFGAATIANDKLTINPTSDLTAGKTYAVQFSAGSLSDAAGNPLAAITDTNTYNFSTVPPNAAPAIGGLTTTTTVNDTATATPFGNVTITDTDNVTVSVTLDAVAKGVFTTASLTASGFTSAGGGVYNLASTSAASAQAAIRQLVFDPTDNRVAPASTEMTTFTISVNDGVNTAVTNNTTTVTATSVNDAPTLNSVTTLTGASEDTSYAITYAVLAAAADEADVDTGSTLSFRVETVSSGNLYTDSGLTTQVTPGTTLLSSGDTWYWKAATHANGTGGSALDAFTVKAWDGTAASATAVQVKVATTAINDIPALTAGTLSAVTALEDSANSTATSLGLGAVTYGPGGGSDESSQTLTYTVTAIPSFVTVYKADGTTAVNATDTVTASELQGLTYKTTANSTGTGDLTWTVVDDGGIANSGVDTLTQYLSITITGVNDAPSRTAGSLTAVSVNEDSANTTATTLGLSAVTYGPGGGSDEASQTRTYTVTAIPSFVTLFKSDGTTAVNVTDTVTAAELAGLKYKTVANANGTGNITWSVVDNGGTANSGANTLTENLSVTVSSVNDAPLLTAGTLTAITAAEDSASTTATTLGLGAVTYGNGGGSDETGQTLTYTITAIPSFITLFKADGTTQVNTNGTVTSAELAGLKYKTVADGYGTGNLTWTVADSGGTTNGGVDSLNQSLVLTLTGVADTPSVTNANTTLATQTSSGLVLSRNAADGAEVTHFKVTGITNGNLFKSDGTTAITNGDFITFAEGNAGLKFTTTGGGSGSFTAQASTSNLDAGLGGSTVNATISVGATVASPTVAEDADSGAIAITQGGSETHYKITGITGGTLFADAGFTTQITEGSFIASAGTTTNVYFRPTADRNTTTGGNGSFVVQASNSNADGGLTGSQLTSTVTLTPVADTPSVTNATAIANAQTTSGLVLSRNAADGAETTHLKITGITGGSLFKNDGTTAITNGTFITFAEGNAGLKFTPSDLTAGSFTAQASSSNVDGGLGGSTVNATINVAEPTLTSATYDATTHVLTVFGTKLPALVGVTNDISVAKLTLKGEGDTTYQLTSNDVDITSSTSFAITLNATDQAGVGTILNKAGLTSTGGATYNIAAATGWAPGYATTPEDLTSNPVTVSAVPVPTLTSATYDASTGALVLTGTGFLTLTGATNEIVANKFTFTGEDGETYTLTNTANVEISSGTAATITLSATDKAAVNLIVNKNGASSTGGTTYNIAAAEDWAAGADAAAIVADLSGNGVDASNVVVPTLTSATYNTGSGMLVVNGTGFVKKSGATNDIDIRKLIFTGQGGTGAAYTLTSASDVEITGGTSFTVTLSGADKTAVDALLNKTGTSANDNTTYVVGGLEDWAAGADAAVSVADEAGNAITVTVFVPAPEPDPAPSPAPTPAPAPVAPPGNNGVTADKEDATPGLPQPGGQPAVAGDGNGDGIKDSQQASVASTTFLQTPTAESKPTGASSTPVSLVADSLGGKTDPDAGNARITSIVQKDAPAVLPEGMKAPLGLIGFTADVDTAGSQETFSLYVDPSLGVNGYWKKDAGGTWVNLASEAYGGGMVEEGGKLRLDFQIVDGGQFDSDGLANGAISDPGIIGSMAQSITEHHPKLINVDHFWF